MWLRMYFEGGISGATLIVKLPEFLAKPTLFPGSD